MNKLTNLLRWIDKNILTILVGGLIFVAPLYPKLPLSNVNYTYVAIRFDDLYIALMFFVFFVQLLRRKVSLSKKFLIPVLLFWGSVFISYFYSFYIQKTIEFKQVGLLNALRRVEYMGVFFIAASSVSAKNFWKFIKLIVFVLAVVSVYGIGQKFLGFPAVQTMNPEYAKGYILFLTPEARISSTFAGHYDLASYLVFLMPFVLGIYFFTLNISYFVAVILAIAALVLTASRVSFIAYIISIPPFLLLIRKPKQLIIIILITLTFTFLSKNLTSRFQRTFQVKQIFVNQKTGQVVVPQKITTKELPIGSFYVQINNKLSPVSANSKALVNSQVLQQIREEASRSGKKLTATEEARLVATFTASLTPVNTVISDISFATRLQVEWPRAISAFLKNPILGTGPSSITEATDNDYLRWIGEFGLLGTLTFFLVLFTIVWQSFTQVMKKKLKDKENYVYLGFLFGIVALMVNAAYIDVFEASKVAYQFWLLSGLIVGYLILKNAKTKS